MLFWLLTRRSSQNRSADDSDVAGLIRLFLYLSAKIRSNPRHPRIHFPYSNKRLREPQIVDGQTAVCLRHHITAPLPIVQPVDEGVAAGGINGR